MTTMLVEPFPPWLRDINRFFSSEGGTTPSAFSPPADVIVTDDGRGEGQGRPTGEGT